MPELSSTALLRPILDKPARHAAPSLSVAAAAAAAKAPSSGTGATPVFPKVVMVKVGGAAYARFSVDEKPSAPDMDKVALLEALRKTHAFGPLLQDVALAACRVYVLKGELAQGKQEPDAADEAAINMLEVKAATTLDQVAASAHCTGDFLWVRVALPDPTRVRLPQPSGALVFRAVTINKNEAWRVAEIVDQGSKEPKSLYLTEEQHQQLAAFIGKKASSQPRVLMPVGTVKCGKSTVVRRVVPGMVAAKYSSGWPEGRGMPVFFHFTFSLGKSAADAVADFEASVYEFGQKINVPYLVTGPSASIHTDTISKKVSDFASEVAAGGGELWLLLDELQAPLLSGTPSQASHFIIFFRTLVSEVSSFARVVATGSGLLSLLNAIRTSNVSSFALWDAVTPVNFGHEPSPGAAQEIASRITGTASTFYGWSPEAQKKLTAAAVVAQLCKGERKRMASPRPALLAYAVGLMEDATAGSPARLLKSAVSAVIAKLQFESIYDTARALAALNRKERQVLRSIATGKYTVAQVDAVAKCRVRGALPFKEGSVCIAPEKFAALINCLREAGKGGSKLRLQPPYTALVESWVRPDGQLAVNVESDELDLDIDTRKNLVFIADNRGVASHALKDAVGEAVLQSLAANGVGVAAAGGGTRPPANAKEFRTVTALSAFHGMLSTDARHATMLTKALRLGDEARFIPAVGWELLVAVRHLEARVWTKPVHLVRNGFTAAVAAEAVQAAVLVLSDEQSGCFALADGRLHPRTGTAAV